MAQKKRNHIVSKVYLKNFTVDNNGRTVHELLKPSKKVILNADIKTVAVEKNFYIQRDKEGVRFTKIEDELAAFERSKFKKVIESLIASTLLPVVDGKKVLTSTQKHELVTVIVHQIVRGKKARAHAEKNSETVYPELLAQLQSDTRITRDKIDLVEANRDHLIRNSIIEASNSEKIEHPLIYNSLSSRITVVFRNYKDVPYITSDEPVLFVSTDNRVGLFNVGLNNPSTIVYFPVSPHILVGFFHRNFLGIDDSLDGKLFSLSSSKDLEFILRYNFYQYQQANECVISNSMEALKLLK